MLLLHGLGHLVHEPDDAPGVRLLLRVDGRAPFALAVVVPIVLRHAVVARIPPPGRLGALVERDAREHVGEHDLEHVGIGEAQLRMSSHALALDEREVFRVRVVVLVRRH